MTIKSSEPQLKLHVSVNGLFKMFSSNIDLLIFVEIKFAFNKKTKQIIHGYAQSSVKKWMKTNSSHFWPVRWVSPQIRAFHIEFMHIWVVSIKYRKFIREKSSMARGMLVISFWSFHETFTQHLYRLISTFDIACFQRTMFSLFKPIRINSSY